MNSQMPIQPATLSFAEMGLSKALLAELSDLGYEEPTPIQQHAIPPLLVGRDLIGQAETGTGKTAAFALPIIEMVLSDPNGSKPSALVLTPTRELAMQVSEAVHRYGRSSGVKVLPVYGGQHIGRQLDGLRRGVDVVVATPGRALDHIRRRSLDLTGMSMVVLDEADEMLDMGFAEDIDEILSAGSSDRQTVLFSATMPDRIIRISEKHLQDPVRISIGRSEQAPGTPSNIEQRAYIVAREHKAAALGRILDVEAPKAAIVFCRTRSEVDNLSEVMNGRGYRAEPLHGGMSQEQRDKVMGRLRTETAELLVATDVAARGLDIDHLTHVFNYDVPADPETYVHRIGRVGRAGRIGTAITLAEPRQQRLLRNIESFNDSTIRIARVPSVSELRSRRLESLRDALGEALSFADLDLYRPAVEELQGDNDLLSIALAALHLAADASIRGDNEDEIPAIAERVKRNRERQSRGYEGKGQQSRGYEGKGKQPRGYEGKRPQGRRTDSGPSDSVQGQRTRLYVGAGSEARIRPGDLVGAIANETSLNGRDIGSIEVHERFSLVDVPSRSVNEVITALNRTTLKGRKVKVRRDRF